MILPYAAENFTTVDVTLGDQSKGDSHFLHISHSAYIYSPNVAVTQGSSVI